MIGSGVPFALNETLGFSSDAIEPKPAKEVAREIARQLKPLGQPGVVINHGASEECGMKALAGHLSEALPNIPVEHVGDGCSYKWYGAG